MRVSNVEVRLSSELVGHIKAGRHLSDHRGIIAYCNIYLDACFVIKEARVIGEIDGMKVSMPDRKLIIRFSCGHKNQYDNLFCGSCGVPRAQGDAPPEGLRRFLDVCHPTDQKFRRHLNHEVAAAILKKVETSNLPGGDV